MLRRFNSFLEKALLTTGILLFVVFIAVVFLQVISRNYLKISMMWIQEVALFSFLWSVFIGGSIAVRRKKHYIVEIFPERMQRLNAVLDILADLGAYAMVYVFLPIGYQYMLLGLNRYSRVLQVPQAFFFAAFPFAGLCFFFFATEVLIQDVRRLRSLFTTARGPAVTVQDQE